ncbi:Phage lysin [Paramixta manurensis]|uniref:Phage lysin n=1 Tax=Paramixta manurensis TaxID=2740817 RepID=A0A6M8UAF8_9GAMM|nr:Phage lysin [Erwiniaceae bacterium PD-1]
MNSLSLALWLKTHWRGLLWMMLLLMVIASTCLISHYHQRAIAAESKMQTQLTLINDLRQQQANAAAIDMHYTQELSDARKTIDQLQHDVIAGRQRLQLNATCRKPSTAAATGVDDDARPRLTDAAQRDYFTLRERIATATQQIAGLQAYIRAMRALP